MTYIAIYKFGKSYLWSSKRDNGTNDVISMTTPVWAFYSYTIKTVEDTGSYRFRFRTRFDHYIKTTRLLAILTSAKTHNKTGVFKNVKLAKTFEFAIFYDALLTLNSVWYAVKNNEIITETKKKIKITL